MGSGNSREKSQQVAYQRDLLGACWDSPYGQQEALQYLPSRWMGLSKNVVELRTGNHCFIPRVIRFDDEAAAADSQAPHIMEEARGNLTESVASLGSAHRQPCSPATTMENASFASLGGGARLRRYFVTQEPTAGPARGDGPGARSGHRSDGSSAADLTTVDETRVGRFGDMPLSFGTSRVGSSAGDLASLGGAGMPPRGVSRSGGGSARDLVAAGVGGGPLSNHDRDSQHGTERAKRDVIQTKTKTLSGWRRSGDSVLRTVTRDAAEMERAVHDAHPYLRLHGLSVFPGVTFRAAPAKRRYDRVSFVAPPAEVVGNYLRHLRGEGGGGGRPGARGGGAPRVGDGDGGGEGNGEDQDSSSGHGRTPPVSLANSPPLTLSPTARPAVALGSSAATALAASAPAFLQTAFGATPRSGRVSPSRTVPRPRHLVLDAADAVATQLHRRDPLNPSNNYPIEDRDDPTVSAVTPPVIVGSVTAVELQSLPANAEVCVGGWLYVSLQDEQRRLRKSLAAYEAKLKERVGSHHHQQQQQQQQQTVGPLGRAPAVPHEPFGSPMLSLTVPSTTTAAAAFESSAKSDTPTRELSIGPGTRRPSAANLSTAGEEAAPLPRVAVRPAAHTPAGTSPPRRMAQSCNTPLVDLLAEASSASVPALDRSARSRGEAGAETKDEDSVAPPTPRSGLGSRLLSAPTLRRRATATASLSGYGRGLGPRSRSVVSRFYSTPYAPMPVPTAGEETWLPYAYLIIALPMYECSMHPSAYHLSTLRSKPISLNMENPLSRRAFGVGCVTAVRYGGVMIVECRDCVYPGEEDWALYLIALGKELAKAEQAQKEREQERQRQESAGLAEPHAAGTGASPGETVEELLDDALPMRSGWSLLMNPSFTQSAQERQRVEHLQIVKRRIRRHLKRQGLYVVSASTRTETQRRREVRRSLALDGDHWLYSTTGAAAAAAAAARSGGGGGVGMGDDHMDNEAGWRRGANSDEEAGEAGAAPAPAPLHGRTPRKARSQLVHRSDKGRHPQRDAGTGTPEKRRRHSVGGIRPGHLPSSDSDSALDGDDGDSASDASVDAAHAGYKRNDTAFRRHRPQRMVRGTFRQLGGMCYLDATALMEGCPVHELIRGIDKWIQNLLSAPVKARPLSLFLQRYEGIATALHVAGNHLTTSHGGASLHVGAGGGTTAGLGARLGASATATARLAVSRIMLPYLTVYHGPLEPVVSAVLPPSIQQLMRRHSGHTPTHPAATQDPLGGVGMAMKATTTEAVAATDIGGTIASAPAQAPTGSLGMTPARMEALTITHQLQQQREGQVLHTVVDTVVAALNAEAALAASAGEEVPSKTESVRARTPPPPPTGKPATDTIESIVLRNQGGLPEEVGPDEMEVLGCTPAVHGSARAKTATGAATPHLDESLAAVSGALRAGVHRGGAPASPLGHGSPTLARAWAADQAARGGHGMGAAAGGPLLGEVYSPRASALATPAAMAVAVPDLAVANRGQTSVSEERAWAEASAELRKLRGELDEIEFLLIDAKTELQERLEEYLTLGSLFLPHTRLDQIDLNVLFLKMLRHFPHEVPVRELRSDWLPSMLALLTTTHEDMFAKDASGAMSRHLANAVSYSDAHDADRLRELFREHGSDSATMYTIESFPPIPQFSRSITGLPPFARLNELTIASAPYRVNPETARVLEQMGMDSGLSFVFTGGSLGVLAGAMMYYTDHVKRTFQDQLRLLRDDGGNASFAPDRHATVAAAAASAKGALQLLEETHTVLLQRILIWGAASGKKECKTLDEWQEMHEGYIRMVDPTHHSHTGAGNSLSSMPGSLLRRFTGVTTGEGSGVGSGNDFPSAAGASASAYAGGASASARARTIQKEMDLHAERVGIPFHSAECFALFDAIAYYLGTLETLEQQFTGASAERKLRKRRSFLGPLLRRSFVGHGHHSTVNNHSLLQSDVLHQSMTSTTRRGGASMTAAQDGETPHSDGAAAGPRHELLTEPFELVVASNYYYNANPVVHEQPQVVPAVLLPRPPAQTKPMKPSLGNSFISTRGTPPADSGDFHFPPAGSGAAGGQGRSREEELEPIAETATGENVAEGGGGVRGTPPRRPLSVPPSPCIDPSMSGPTAVTQGGRGGGGGRDLASSPAEGLTLRDPAGWVRLVRGSGTRLTLSSKSNCRGKRGVSGVGAKKARGLARLLPRKIGKKPAGGVGAVPPRGNEPCVAGSEEPYCGGEEEKPPLPIYTKLQKDAKKLHKLLEECLEKWRKHKESHGGPAAAYAKRIRIVFE